MAIFQIRYNKARNLWYLYKHSDASTGSGELDFVINSEIFGYNTIIGKKMAVGLPDYYLYVKEDLARTRETVAQAFANSFNFKFVQGTAGAVNYYSITDFVFPWNRHNLYYRPYPEDGTWNVIPNHRNQWQKE